MVQLLDMIRSDASLAEIKFYLDDERPRVEDRKRAIPARLREVLSNDHNGNVNGNGNGSGSGGDEQQQSPIPAMRSEVNPEFLADIPRFDVPAAPWTTVVQNAKLVSQLVSLWFTWFHPFLNWVDRDLFIQDMRSGNPRARFCSPLLVNAMLAVACVCVSCSYLGDHLITKFRHTQIMIGSILFSGIWPPRARISITKRSSFLKMRKGESLLRQCRD